MKKYFNSRFMPNVKFRTFKYPSIVLCGKDFGCVSIDKFIRLDNSSFYHSIEAPYISTNEHGEISFYIWEESYFNSLDLVEVSIFEAMPEIVPKGMTYNKELDNLIPYAMDKEDIRLKRLNFEYSESTNKSNIDKHKEELAKRMNQQNGFENTNFEEVSKCFADSALDIAKALDTLPPIPNSEFIKPKINEHITERENGFIKADKNKIDFSLVDAKAYEDLGKVLTFGAKKYAPDNWKKGDINTYISALERHLIEVKKALQSDNKSLFVDSDSDLQHGAALIFNAMAVHYFIEKELNDN